MDKGTDLHLIAWNMSCVHTSYILYCPMIRFERHTIDCVLTNTHNGHITEQFILLIELVL